MLRKAIQTALAGLVFCIGTAVLAAPDSGLKRVKAANVGMSDQRLQRPASCVEDWSRSIVDIRQNRNRLCGVVACLFRWLRSRADFRRRRSLNRFSRPRWGFEFCSTIRPG